MLKFEKDFKIPLEAPHEEWILILDLADNNYLKCMGIPQDYYRRSKEKKNLGIPSREKTKDINFPKLDKKTI